MIEKSKIKNQKSKLYVTVQNFAFCIVILIFTFCILNFHCYAQAVSSADLIENAKDYDGKDVVYQGEAIGDIMTRKGYAWINVYDADNAIGVWMSKDLSKEVKFTGSYKTKGDILKIEGTFNRVCKLHGGDLDIHADSLVIIKEGKVIAEIVELPKKKLVGLVLSFAFILWISQILKLRQRRKLERQEVRTT